MSYTTSKGVYVDALPLNLSPAAALTTDTTGAAVELGHNSACVRLKLSVTAVSADDTLDVTIQGCDDGTNWYTLGTFTQVTGTGTERKAFPGARQIRPHFNVTGSDVSIACTLTGEAV